MSNSMQEIEGQTLFIVGDSQVGKTTIARRLFENHNLMFVSSEDGASEYRVFLPGREFPVRILEIRSHAFLAGNAIEFNDETDLAFFCYAVDDPNSFQHVHDMWIPLFNEHVCDTLPGVLIGNKKDLRNNFNVLHNLAKRGLQPVSVDQGTELFDHHDTIDVFVEWAINDFQAGELLRQLY